MKYSLGEIARICKGKILNSERKVLSYDDIFAGFCVNSVFTDSRSFRVDAESLFIAISGSNHDGHAYINELYSRGVRAFLIEKDVKTEKYNSAAFIRVDNSIKALQDLAADYRTKFKGTVIGVTGSNGKTVVKEWIAGLVPPDVRTFRSPKSYNSQIGVPLSVLMISGEEGLAVIEAGISEKGEMERLQNIIRPDIGVITMLGDAHQENFRNSDEKLEEKIKLFTSAKIIIYNGNYPEIESALKKKFSVTELLDSAGQTVPDFFRDMASRENAATAITVCDALGYNHENTLQRLKDLENIAMRLEIKDGINNSILINDSYNSDLNSLSIALDYLESVSGGKEKTLILSDILQSGYPEKELYKKVANFITQSGITYFVGIGERINRYQNLFDIPSEFYISTDAYLKSVKGENIANKAILLKGNRLSRFELISHALELKSHTTILEVDLNAVIHNLNANRAFIGNGVRIMAMIKASAYGHGAYEIAGEMQREGVDYLAVAFADEGVELRQRGIKIPIVVLNADSGSFEMMVANSLEPEIYNFQSLSDFINVLKRYGEREYPIHIKLDTGMHRLGFGKEDIAELTEKLNKNKDRIRVGSIFSHLASSDNVSDDVFTRTQIDLFQHMGKMIIQKLGYRPLLHIANSAAIARFPEARFDMVRLGIGLYGGGFSEEIETRPVSTLKTRIVQIKDLSANDTVGYGCEGKIINATKTATIPVGYADGLDRRLGNGNWSVMVNGERAPFIGRICMDTAMIDITGIDVCEGDTVEIYGKTTGNTVEDMAKALDTISYEIMTGISARVKRIYLKE